MNRRSGFSLLEMLLALAILAGALGVLGQMAGLGVDSAREARDLAVARLICQSKLSELLLASTSPQAIVSAPVDGYDSDSLTPFLYSVDVAPSTTAGLLAIRVRVDAINPDTDLPLVSYSLVRWMVDPAMGLQAKEDEEKAAAAAAAETQASESSASGEAP